MKKMTVALSAVMLLGMSSKAIAQVNDVTLTVSPLAGYTIWDKNLNLSNSPFWGVRAGFGFGRNLELRASYERSFDLKGKLKGSGWSLLNTLGDKITDQNVRIERIGGELKANLWHGTTFVPYLTAGAGLLKFKYDEVNNQNYNEEQLYAALGAGVKINFSKRAVLSLEAKNTLFNVNKNNRYLALGANADNLLQNWGGQASLDFYLGGNPNTRAYRAVAGDGFRGIKFVLEPGVAYIDFNKKTIFNDQWLVGGSAGIDFSSLIGIRGFYYAATKKPQTLNLKFSNDLKMYGANLIARLSQPRGITPYLTLGAGYLDIKKDSYVDKMGTNLAKSGWFAMGGAGLEFPINRYVALYGNVNALVNSQDDIDNIYEPSQVNVSLMYQAGLRFNIGSRGRLGESVYGPYAERARLEERTANMRQINELRAKYDRQINELNKELAQAVEERDAAKVSVLVEERKQLVAEKEEVTTEVAKQELVRTPEIKTVEIEPAKSNTVVMTRAQLEELVTRVTQGKAQPQQLLGDSNLSELDKVLLYTLLSNQGYRLPQSLNPLTTEVAPQILENKTQTVKPESNLNEAVLRRLESLERKLDLQAQMPSKEITVIDADGKVTQLTETPKAKKSCCKPSSASTVEQALKSSTTYTNELNSEVMMTSSKNFLNYKGTSVLAGLGFGDATTFNLAVRPKFQMGSSDFSLVPEFFYGLGSRNAWGLTANAVYNFNFGLKNLRPYAGLGLGYTHADIKGGRLGTNIIIGTTLTDVLGGRLFVDYSLRPHFRNHQIAVGYSLPF